MELGVPFVPRDPRISTHQVTREPKAALSPVRQHVAWPPRLLVMHTWLASGFTKNGWH